MFKKLYRGLVIGESFLGHIFLLVIRLYWGALLIMVGAGKWMHISKVSDYFSSLDIAYPVLSAYSVATLELIGGISLILGFLSRICTIPLVVIFVVAYATAHVDSVRELWTNPAGFVSQEPFHFLLASLIVLCFGAGAISFDYLWERKTL